MSPSRVPTLQSQSAPAAWADSVRQAVAALRGQGDAHLPAAQRDDLGRLLAAATELEALLGGKGGDSATGQSAHGATTPASGDHDLRNLLGALQGYAELLLETPDDLPSKLQSSLEGLLHGIAAYENARQRKAPLATPPERNNSSAAPGTILVVDDSADSRNLLTRHLRRAGHQVIDACSGQQALSVLQQQDLDLVLLDLIMPGMDGGEVLARIKANANWRPIPVIVISGRQDMDGIIACIEAGADDYLFKPFNRVLLQARIKAGLERKRWHDREELYLGQLERNQKFIRATFGRYVSDEVVQNLLEQPEGLKLGGDLREVTMLMSDIREFSSICEKLPPADVMSMLNNYLGAMSDIIIGHQGIIDEFIGDAILAIFGAPVTRDDDADRAVQCALDMQQAMRDINRHNRAAGLPEISMGIGVNTGAVIAGNIGSEKRSKYGVVGHQVNITARIESHSGGGEVLVSGSTLGKLRAPLAAGAGETLQVKGINETVTVHRLPTVAGGARS